MESTTSYAAEKFGAGVLCLAVGADGVRERLVDAFRSQIGNAFPPGPDVPPDIAQQMRDLHARVTSKPDDVVGSYEATISAMTEDEGVEVATEVYRIMAELKAELENRRP